MKTVSVFRTLMTAAALFAVPAMAIAGDAISAPAQKTIGSPGGEMIPSLGVINSHGASLQGGTLTMNGVSLNAIVFADRPVRAAGHVLTKDFLKDWDAGVGTFAKDPPNATISVLSADGASVEDAVVVLKSPKLDGDKLTFKVAVLEGKISKATGPAALFIDWFAARGFRGRAVVGGAGFRAAAWRRPAWRGAWYAHPAARVGVFAAGAAVGAAAASAQPCGYYPYPDCN